MSCLSFYPWPFSGTVTQVYSVYRFGIFIFLAIKMGYQLHDQYYSLLLTYYEYYNTPLFTEDNVCLHNDKHGVAFSRNRLSVLWHPTLYDEYHMSHIICSVEK